MAVASVGRALEQASQKEPTDGGCIDRPRPGAQASQEEPTAMSKLRKVQLATVLAWLFVLGVSGWLYVTSQLALPGLEGYETWWTAQAWFFLLTRGPPAVVGLAILLSFERRLVAVNGRQTTSLQKRGRPRA
jgi:hypothetical protein